MSKQLTTTSLKVAEVFGKRHDSVLRDIDTLTENLGQVADLEANHKSVGSSSPELFAERTYINHDTKHAYRYVEMNRDGLVLLVMGYTGKRALLDHITNSLWFFEG